MTKLQIRMRQVDQVKDFVNLLSKYPYEMDLVSGRYTMDHHLDCCHPPDVHWALVVPSLRAHPQFR